MARKRKIFTDEEIVQGLRAGENENKILRQLYDQSLRPVTNLVLRNNGTQQDAEDIFQDAIKEFRDRVISGKYEKRANTKITTYICTLALNMWKNQLNKAKRNSRYVDAVKKENRIGQEREDIPKKLLEKDKSKIFEYLMSQLKGGCRKALDLWSHGFSMKEIAERMGYKNDQIAMNKKNKCRKYFKKMILESPVFLVLLKEIR